VTFWPNGCEKFPTRRGAGPAAQGLSELLPAGPLGAGGAEATLGSQMLRLRAALPLAPLE